MTLIQQQRLIGALLLVFVFSGVAYFLMSRANQNDELIADVKPVEQNENFTSSIEAIPEGDIEVISNEIETLIDPHDLESIEVALDQLEEPVVIVKPVEHVITESILKQDVEAVTPSWFLQLASFSVEKNAQTLQKQAVTLGYDANIHSMVSAKGQIYRVRIGPNNNKLVLQKASNVLNKKLGLESQIVQKTQ